MRIYQPGEYAPGESIELSPSAAQHVGVVLRMQAGDKLTLFSGNNKEFVAIITHSQRKNIKVTILETYLVSRESPQVIHLGQAVSKGERMEWVIQKATELGVTSITPVITARCSLKLDRARMEKKLAQWRAIAIAACEQCGRNQLPIINPPMQLHHYLQKKNGELALVLVPDSDKRWQSYQAITAPAVALLVGPEGGFAKNEQEAILAAYFQALSLGPRILRTETAAIAALSILQALYGDL